MHRTRILSAVAALSLSVSLAAHAATNLLKNGDFEGGDTAPWSVYGSATITLDTKTPFDGKGCGFVQVNAAGANFWDSGLQYAGVEFKANTQYTFAAFVKAEGAKDINFKPELAQDPWTGFGEQMKNIGTDWKEYYVEFQPAAVVTPASLTLHIAADDKDFWIDSARWYEGKYEPAAPPAAVEPSDKLATTWAKLKER
jgi:hypothetical protein